jgi:peptidoglycan hydrolase-like protein with peptidoglycan-binding domain
MSGSPRDLAVVDHWSASLERSLARRARAERGLLRRAAHSSTSLAALLANGHTQRDLADEAPWELSLGRSRARRRAAQLRFVPTGSRAKRVSLGALAALTVGPTASLASGQSTVGPVTSPEPVTTTEHVIVVSSGEEGRQVQLLQKALGSVKVDGVFGPETEAAVRSFQASRGLSVDGIVGPQTSAALRSQSASQTFIADVSSTLPGTVSLPAPAATSATSEGTGAGEGTTTTASATDVADVTSSATGGYEAAAEIEPAEAEAEAKIVESERQAEEKRVEETELGAVKQLQSALHVSADGDFGPATEAAVRRLQARHGLTVDGIVGPATWSVIGVRGQDTLTPPASALPKPAAPKPAAAIAATSDTGLTAGSGGTEEAGQAAAPATGATAVEWLQKALKLSVDGEFGPETEAAVRRLQARHGLSVDGVVGPSTWALIGVQDAATLTPPSSALVAPSTSSGTSGEEAGASAGGGEAESVVARVIAAADEIATRPYVWGGGHGSFESYGYDCSGSVSYALHGGGLLSSPEDSTGLESFGEAGPGKYITIYANAEHAYMVIDGKRFDTVALAEDGSRWGGSSDDGGGFVERHPAGL